MTLFPASRPDDRTLSAFLASIKGSESGPHSGRHRTIGLSTSESGSPAESETSTGLPTACDSQSYRQNPAVLPEPTQNTNTGGMAELAVIVTEIALDADALPTEFPFTGEQVREHYRRLVRRDGVAAALHDARQRYAALVQMHVLPLPAEVA